MRRIGIMGGTFNPIHIGHLLLAEWALDAVSLDEVWFIPAGMPYKKDTTDLIAGIERFHMTDLAVRDNPHFKCLDLEVRREGFTYTYETLELLRNKYPEDRFFFIVGADCLFSIETWKYPDRILNCCTLIAALRGDADMQEMNQKKYQLEQKFTQGYQNRIILLPFVSMSISSTEIRQRVSRGESIKYLVPDSVLAYVKEKGFYSEVSFEKATESNEKGAGRKKI